MPDEKAHVDWAVEGIENEVEIDVFAQLAAADTPAQGGVSFPAARPQETVAKGSNDVFIALSGGQDGGNDAAARAAEDFYQLAHLPAHIGEDGTGIGEA